MLMIGSKCLITQGDTVDVQNCDTTSTLAYYIRLHDGEKHVKEKTLIDCH